MFELSDLIEYENENTSLDFKAVQYSKENNDSFLKDLISLANAITTNKKYIIVGVKHFPDGSRNLLGIDEPFIDDAQYQQLVLANIEPDLDFKYFPYQYKEMTFGIIHIIDCSNPPYMMKKNNGKLKPGDSFIRKGSHNTNLLRPDIDNLINYKKTDLSKNIILSFSDEKETLDLIIKKNEFKFPSNLEKEKIENALAEKEKSNSIMNNYTISPIHAFSFTPYEKRSIQTLKKDLETVVDDYKQEDEYYFFEKNAHKVNFYIHNNNSTFLENVSIEVTIDKSEDFCIAQEIYRKPQKYNPFSINSPKPPTSEEINYPNVQVGSNNYKIFAELENIKHHLPTTAFQVPIRMTIVSTKDCTINLNVKIFAKNLSTPILKFLTLKVTV